ncbi:hypothetical protein B566_EDAN004756 [Ephemera danica]|nr:hypothetical protein B566_EDAN004756 [Ephemera danica]
MKFTLQSVTQCAGRLGTLSEVERLPGLMMETPMLFLHTKGGVVPHLTFETLQMITKDHYPLSVSVESSLQCVHPISKMQKPLAEFIGMKEHLVFCGIHNTGVPLPHGYNGKLQVSMWTKAGREVMDAERYMDTIEKFQPDIYQTLCDADTNSDCSKKRLQKAVDSTYSFFKECMRRHQESKALRNSTLLASLGGGYNVHLRGSSAKLLAKVPVKGFVIDGLCANGSAGEDLNSENISSLVKESLKYIPVESFRMAPGCWRPELVWHLVKLGVDSFDSSLPSVAAARGAALTFQFDPTTGK